MSEELATVPTATPQRDKEVTIMVQIDKPIKKIAVVIPNYVTATYHETKHDYLQVLIDNNLLVIFDVKEKIMGVGSSQTIDLERKQLAVYKDWVCWERVK